jgi:type VI secretion system protein ImpJ
MMDIERSLYWHQGLFLQPQHFQLLERSLQSLVVPFYDFAQPHFWGVGEMEIQKAALGTRSFNPLKGNLLFPDGSHAVFPGNAVIEPRPFDEAWIEGGKSLTVYAGLRKWNHAGENVTVLEKFEDMERATTRFIALADPEEVKDLHSGGPVGRVQRLYYALKLFWETEKEKLGDYLLLPIAQLERMGDEVRLSERFAPPSLALSSAKSLMQLVKEIRDQIAARSRQLEELKNQRGIQTAEFGSRDMVYLLALRSLNRYVPILFHFTEARQVHPWAVYALLRQLIGELSSFSEKVDVMGFVESENRALPTYNHEALWDCFSQAQILISQLLDEITAGPEYVIRLVYDGTYYAAELKPAIFEGRNRFYLVFRTESEPKAVIRSVITIAKLSSREHLPILIARALPGVRLEHLPVPPQELPRRAHSIYFAVDYQSDPWVPVKKGNNVAFYWDNAPEDLEVELMVVGR